MKNLIHLFDKGGVFSDLTLDLNDYDVDTSSLVMVNNTDFLYTGLYKKFKNLFVSIKENTVAGNLSFEYFNGTAWVALPIIDESRNYSRSGFIKWDLPDDWALATVNSKEMFFIRVTGDIEVEINGLNMVFANDNDLKEHYREINSYIGSDSSFIALHQACRKDIIQKIRNSGKTKVSSIDCTLTDLTIWDFMRPDQLRNAASYLCLSKIFAGVSDNSEGKFFQLSRTFRKEYKEAVDTFLMNVDFDDNGQEDSNEQSESVNITRIVTL